MVASRPALFALRDKLEAAFQQQANLQIKNPEDEENLPEVAFEKDEENWDDIDP